MLVEKRRNLSIFAINIDIDSFLKAKKRLREFSNVFSSKCYKNFLVDPLVDLASIFY